MDGDTATDRVDTDLDGLDDPLERAMGLDPSLNDTDADGFGDALEVRGRTDPMDARANPLSFADDPLQPTTMT
jgi:hypothetical protein